MKFPKEVYELLGISENENEWDTREVTFFDSVNFKKVVKLGEILGESFLNGRHNDAPSVRIMLKTLKETNLSRHTSFSGYMVSEKREDARVTIDSFSTMNRKTIHEFVKNATEVKKNANRLVAWWD